MLPSPQSLELLPSWHHCASRGHPGALTVDWVICKMMFTSYNQQELRITMKFARQLRVEGVINPESPTVF